MANIVISTVGTLGDVVPFLALGQALQAGGHHIVVAVNSGVHSLVQGAGLEAAPCGPCFGPDEACRPPAAPETFGKSLPEVKYWEALFSNVPARYRDLRGACAHADLLVAHSFHSAALLVHDRLGVPWVCVALLPGQYAAENYIGSTAQPAPRADLNLLAFSLSFSPPNMDIYDHGAVTGFWFYEGLEQDAWQPTAAQRDFIESADKPLALCLGSLPGLNAADIVSIHAQACERLGKNLVVQTGWADLPKDFVPCGINPRHILMTPFLAHDWLFARAEAVIHHGGIGVTARALKHGCPVLVEPYRKDQFHHAALIRNLKAGHAMHLGKLTVEGVARMLAEKVCVAETRHCAQEIGRMVCGEDGIASACQLIENQIGRSASMS